MPEGLSYAYLFIVRHGCEDKLAFLQEVFARRPNVRVIADRRRGDRRAREQSVTVDRRRADRRASPPPSWDLADYVLVPDRHLQHPGRSSAASS